MKNKEVVATKTELPDYTNITKGKWEITQVSKSVITVSTQELTYLGRALVWVNFKFKISETTVNQLLKEFEVMSGRDIRNLLKMITKCHPKEKTITVDMISDIEDFIPFLKRIPY